MKRTNSITTRFISVLLLILVIGQGMGVFLFLQYNRSSLVTALHERMQRTVRESSGIAGEPIINYNFPLIDSYQQELLKDRDVVSIAFLDKEGKVIREQRADRGKRKIFDASRPIVLSNETIGTVKLQYTTTTIDESMKRSLLLIPLYQGVLLVVVALVLVRLFNSSVKRPVMEINRAIERITAGDLSVKLPVLRNDEIGIIANGVGFLAERLSATISRIDSISENVTLVARQLHETFGRVQGKVDSEQKLTGEVIHSVREAGESQTRISDATEKLLSLSSDNVSALLEMSATSEEIAGSAESLSKNLQNSYSAMQQLTQSAKQVAGMSDEVSAAVEHASVSVADVYRSVREVENIVRESAKVSEDTATLVSEQGMSAVSDATGQMASIQAFMHELTGVIEKLSARSRDITNILAVIEGVTEKTRLLSLNAQIIAAQSGEAGRGFSVVADEMKELSEQTAISTREIETIVSDISGEIGEVVSSIGETVVMVKDANAVVDKTSTVLTDILHASRQASEMAKKIEQASSGQTKGLELVVSATEQIKKRIFEVNRAMQEQGRGTEFLFRNINPVREAMEMTRRATEEQAGSTRLISGNIELANQKTGEIAASSVAQLQLNERIIESLSTIRKMADETVGEIDETAGFITSLRDEVESLRREMEMFRAADGNTGAKTASEDEPVLVGGVMALAGGELN